MPVWEQLAEDLGHTTPVKFLHLGTYEAVVNLRVVTGAPRLEHRIKVRINQRQVRVGAGVGRFQPAGIAAGKRTGGHSVTTTAQEFPVTLTGSGFFAEKEG